MSELHVVDHPLVQHKLTFMRKKETTNKDFRELLEEITLFVGCEATKDLPLAELEIETPVSPMVGKQMAGRQPAIIPVLRAGLGMVDGLLSLMPAAKVGHIGMYRDETTHEPVKYYCKLPVDIDERMVFICDPMLATGGSACDAIQAIKEAGAKRIRLINLVAAPEGVKKVQEEHPDVDIYCAALDECLNANAYIVPGLGDAGDRLYGTK